MSKRSPSVDLAVDTVKTGQLLIKDGSKWSIKRVQFDSTTGIFQVGDEKFTLDFQTLEVKPSPFRLVQIPDSMVLHLSPLDIHVTATDRATLLDWTYCLRTWIRDKVSQNVFLHPLSLDEKSTVTSLLSSDDSTPIVEKFGIQVSKKTLSCLSKNEWLSDEIINFYISLLSEKYSVFVWSTFFWSKLAPDDGSYNYTGVRNWGNKKGLRLKTPPSLILVPMHIEKAHWALGVVDFEKNTSQYLDSLGPHYECPLFHEYILKYLKDESKGEFSESLIPIPAPADLACQQNGSDCGVFLCLFALALARRLPLSRVTPSDVALMRKRMVLDITKGMLELSRQLRNQSRESQKTTLLLTTLRAAIADPLPSPPRVVGELYGLLVSDIVLPRSILVLVTMLIRQLSMQVPKFILENFKGSLASYSRDRILFILDIISPLETPPLLLTQNIDFLLSLFVADSTPYMLRIKAFSLLKSIQLASSVIARLNAVIAPFLLCSSSGFELDGSVSVGQFTPLVHSLAFSTDQLMHLSLVSVLREYVVNIQSVAILDSVSPPNTPVGSAALAASLKTPLHTAQPLHTAILSLAIRVMEQSWLEIDLKKIPNLKKKFTNEFIEQTVFEIILILDLICVSDPTLVSTVFPTIRKTFDRLVLRPDSPGIAITSILQFFLNHGYLVMFDPEPCLRFFFKVHLARLPKGSPLLAVSAAHFLTNMVHLIPSVILNEFFSAIIRLAAWFPRTVDLQKVVAQVIQPHHFDALCDIPLVAALMELSTDINHYVMNQGEDLFVESRKILRIARSAEFQNFSPLLWKGLPVTPRVAAASKLVLPYLTLLLTSPNPVLAKSCLQRFGSRMFQFRPQIAQLLIDYLGTVVQLDPEEIVAALCDRVHLPDSSSQLLVAHMISRMAVSPNALFVKTLTRLLITENLNVHDVVYLQFGRVVTPPAQIPPPCLPVSSIPLACLVVSSLARIAAANPQYRPQILHVLDSTVPPSIEVAERIRESISILHSVHLCPILLA